MSRVADSEGPVPAPEVIVAVPPDYWNLPKDPEQLDGRNTIGAADVQHATGKLVTPGEFIAL